MTINTQHNKVTANTTPCSFTKGWGGLISETAKNVTYSVLGTAGSILGSGFTTAQNLPISTTSLATGGFYTVANLVSHLGIKGIQSCIPSYKKADESSGKAFSRLLCSNPLELVKLVAGTFVSGAISTALPYYSLSEEDFITGNETTATDYTTLPSTTDDSTISALTTLGVLFAAYTAQFTTCMLINGASSLRNRCLKQTDQSTGFSKEKVEVINDIASSFISILPDFSNVLVTGIISVGAGIGTQASVLTGLTGAKYIIDVFARQTARKKVEQAIEDKLSLLLSPENKENLTTLKEDLHKSGLTIEEIEEIGKQVFDIPADDQSSVAITIGPDPSPTNPQPIDINNSPQNAPPNENSRASTPDSFDSSTVSSPTSQNSRASTPDSFDSSTVSSPTSQNSRASTPDSLDSLTESSSTATSPADINSPDSITAPLSQLVSSPTSFKPNMLFSKDAPFIISSPSFVN